MELLRDRSAEFEEAGVRAFGDLARLAVVAHRLDAGARPELPAALGLERRGRARLRRRARATAACSDVAERTAFLVDADGTVRGAWRYETAEVPDLDELLAAARAL